MSKLDRLVFIVEISVVTYSIALALGYGWIRAMHYPFTLRQRKMWVYYVLFISALPILCPLMVILGLWVMSVEASSITTILGLIIWMIAAFWLVRRMSKPGGRLSEDDEDHKESNESSH